MKIKIIILVGMFACVSAYGEYDYLDVQINELTAQRDKLKSELSACEKNTQGYKIAGISTLAATGVGVYGNVRLAQEIKKVKESKNGGGGYSGGAVGGVPKDTRTEEHKVSDECKMFCGDMPDEAMELGCEC